MQFQSYLDLLFANLPPRRPASLHVIPTVRSMKGLSIHCGWKLVLNFWLWEYLIVRCPDGIVFCSPKVLSRHERTS